MKERHVALIIFYTDDGRALLQSRWHKPKQQTDWDLFGGGIDDGETPEQALVREIKEELDFDLKEFTFLMKDEQLMPGPWLAKAHVFTAPLKDNLKKFTQLEGDEMRLFTFEECQHINTTDATKHNIRVLSEKLKLP